MILNQALSPQARAFEIGHTLAETPMEQGGWAEMFCESEAGDMRIKDDMLRSSTALMLENAKQWISRHAKPRRLDNGLMTIDETTRSATVGGFSDYLFPIIRAAFPNNPLNDLVSVQPTNRRVATVMYFNYVVGSNKGSYTKGQRLFDANTGKPDSGYHFSDNVVDGETVAVTRSNGGGTNDVAAGTLAFNDGGGVVPGSVSITIAISANSPGVISDDGNGGLSIVDSTGASVAVDSSSINYSTGAWSIDIDHTAATFAADTATATYAWDSEGSSSLPEVDIQIATTTTETQRRALKLKYSLEAMYDAQQEFGLQVEPTLIRGCAEQLNFEIARQVVSRMWGLAAVNSTFSITPGSGISQQEHFRDLIYNINSASNNIWSRTQKGYGNWIIVDEGAANVIESLPATMFAPAGRPADVMGIHFIGTLMSKYRVYKDVHLANETGASAVGNILMGFKGTEFHNAGLVWSPYQMMYMTDALTRADFVTERGLASRYALKVVNPDFYVRINLSA